jgi:hypothetical protein
VLNVSKSHLKAAIVVSVVVGLAISIALAQGPSRTTAGAGPRIAMLDVNFVFENHTVFNAKKADLMAEMEQAQEWVKQEN